MQNIFEFWFERAEKYVTYMIGKSHGCIISALNFKAGSKLSIVHKQQFFIALQKPNGNFEFTTGVTSTNEKVYRQQVQKNK